MSLAGSQKKVFLRLLTVLRPNWHSDVILPAGISEVFAANRSFGSRDRKLYRELIYTTLRFLPWVEPLLDTDPERAAKIVAWLASDLPATRAYRAELCRDWPSCPPKVAAKAAQLGADPGTLLPAWFARHCPPAALSPNLDTLHTRASLWLRLHTSDGDRVLGEFSSLEWKWRRAEVLPSAVELLAEADVTKAAAWSAGLFEVQDLGSQLILAKAGIAPGGHWLDACAGAGGKTLQLASLLGPAGRVDAFDIRPSALKELSIRATRARQSNITILSAPPTASYDGVLVDAPCTGTGTWRRSPHLKWTTSAGDVAKAAERQLALLGQFSSRVKTGGRLVYATCSLSRLENDDVAAAFLAAHPDFAADGPDRTLLPATHNTDAFFVAAFRRA